MKKTIGISPLEDYLSQSRKPKAASEVQHNEPVIEHVQQTETESVLVQAVSEPDVSAHAQLNAQPEVVRGEQLTIDQSLYPQDQVSGASKQRITLHISAEVIDRVKNAVYWEPGLTIAGFAEEALEKALNELEADRGAAFPRRRQHRLRGGRPLI